MTFGKSFRVSRHLLRAILLAYAANEQDGDSKVFAVLG